METPQPKAHQPRIRFGRVAIVSILATVGALAIMDWTYHPIIVRLHDGVWCVRFQPDGSGQRLYGDACKPTVRSGSNILSPCTNL